MSFADISKALTSGSSVSSLVDDALTRCASDKTGAVLRIHRERALAAAQRADERRAAGTSLPLDGVATLAKDNLCIEGVAVEACSRILAGFQPPYTATAVERLEAAGAIVIGQTSMDEFAMGSSNETSRHGPVANPHDPERIPGGSSGGSAAAVGGKVVSLALGSDTGGSIRQPASLCGCVGFKPSYGRISRSGLLAFASSLDQIGPLTTTVADARVAALAMAGNDPKDSTTAPRPVDELNGAPRSLAGLKVGWIPDHDDGLAPAVQERLASLRSRLSDAGAELVEVSLPHERYAVAVYYVVATGEASSNLGRYDGVHYGHRSDSGSDLAELYTRSRAEGFGDEVKRRIMLGTYVLSAGYFDAYYRKAMKVRNLICQDYAAIFNKCDVLLGPTSPTTAFRHGEKTDDPLTMYLSDIFTIAANLAGIPALSLPCGTDADGLPIGAHLQGPQWHDGPLLDIAEAVEGILKD
jgi:aspartyl-tRNA(Asn)/glutamyl-tRNA(Gln) amidotransferase subunit A